MVIFLKETFQRSVTMQTLEISSHPNDFTNEFKIPLKP